MSNDLDASPGDLEVVEHTRHWLERAVIGLNLCPFAKSVHVKGQVHYAVTGASDDAELMAALAHEMDELVARPAEERDTTLLIVPRMLRDFFDFNAFLARAERLLAKKHLDGVLQVASFHPHFQFADLGPDDVANCTNRAPYPTLHLLREESVDRAVEAFPEADAIYEANIRRLRELGPEGWRELGVHRP